MTLGVGAKKLYHFRWYCQNSTVFYRQRPLGILPPPKQTKRYIIKSSMGEREQQWPAPRVRDTFLNFFKEKAHTFGDFFKSYIGEVQANQLSVPSSSVVPHNDPTLLFANAGMNQYKAIFLGTVDPNSDFGKLKRAVNSQKASRAEHPRVLLTMLTVYPRWGKTQCQYGIYPCYCLLNSLGPRRCR